MPGVPPASWNILYIVAPTAVQIDEFYSKSKAREWIFLPPLRWKSAVFCLDEERGVPAQRRCLPPASPLQPDESPTASASPQSGCEAVVPPGHEPIAAMTPMIRHLPSSQ
jgi:hypothetical protein